MVIRTRMRMKINSEGASAGREKSGPASRRGRASEESKDFARASSSLSHFGLSHLEGGLFAELEPSCFAGAATSFSEASGEGFQKS